MDINGNIATFDSELVLESSFGTQDLGIHKNRMEFGICEGGTEGDGYIVWNYGKDAPDEDETVIGVSFEGKELVDYEGVFSLPSQAVELLESLGYDCSYAKD